MQVGSMNDEVKAGQESNLPQPRLVRAARDFEGQMMKELLKPMTDSAGLTGEDAEGILGSGSGALGGFASDALGQALSQQGGFGMADRIIAQLSHSGNSVQWRESNNESGR